MTITIRAAAVRKLQHRLIQRQFGHQPVERLHDDFDDDCADDERQPCTEPFIHRCVVQRADDLCHLFRRKRFFRIHASALPSATPSHAPSVSVT